MQTFERQTAPIDPRVTILQDPEGLPEAKEEAFSAIVEEHSIAMQSVAKKIIGRDDIVEDITQDAFLRAWAKFDTYDETRGDLGGWLATIAANSARNHLRTESVRPSSPAFASTPGANDPEATIERAQATEHQDPAILWVNGRQLDPVEQLAHLEAIEALSEMSDTYKEELGLYLAGVTPSEISQYKDIHPNNAKARAHRARQSAKKAITGKLGIEELSEITD